LPLNALDFRSQLRNLLTPHWLKRSGAPYAPVLPGGF